MQLSHLEALEAESMHIIREVAAEFERPVLLFSGGKDSAVMLHLAWKAFKPARIPFPVMHVDTGHNFDEVISYRDEVVGTYGVRLIVASVQDSIDKGRVVEETGPRASRNRLQTTTLLDGIQEHQFDAVFGGGRRDEEKARAKERVFSFRDEFGQWDPKNQRPELWRVYNTRINKGESIRVFPLSNWTELDIWTYIMLEKLPVVPLYFAKDMPTVMRDGTIIVVDDDVDPTNVHQVLWAMATRSRPAQAIDILRETWSTFLDPSLNPPEIRPWGSKALINACMDYKHIKSFSPRTKLDKATYDRVVGRWAELGLADVGQSEPDPALFGYALEQVLQRLAARAGG